MKKLMIALAAVALAAVSQAAATNWNANLGTTGAIWNGYVTADGSSTASAWMGATMYLVDYAAHTQADVIDALKNNTFSVADFALKDKDGHIVTAVTGTGGKITAANGTVFTSNDYEAGSAYKFYAMVLSGDEKFIYLSAEKQVTAYDSSKTQNIAPTTTATSKNYIGTVDEGYTAAGWYQTVPEPTSGLLMLLGMAGLALRRRCA